MKIQDINKIPRPELHQEFFKCCSSMAWVENLAKCRPFKNISHLMEEAEKIWFSLEKKEWLEAFSGHPQIGDLSSLQEKYGNTSKMASKEQSGVDDATQIGRAHV